MLRYLRTLRRLYGSPTQLLAALRKALQVASSEGIRKLGITVLKKVRQPSLRYDERTRPLNAEEDIWSYRAWLATQGDPPEEHEVGVGVLVTILSSSGKASDDTVRSVLAQSGRQIVICSTMDEVNLELGNSDAEWVMIVRSGDTLLPHALQRMVHTATRAESLVVYADHDFVGQDEKPLRPYFKPEFSPRLLLEDPNYLGICLIHMELARMVSKNACESPEEFSAFAALVAGNVTHVDGVLSRLRDRPATSARQLQRLLDGTGNTGQIVVRPDGRPRVQWQMPPASPKVSLLVPFRDKVGLLKNLLRGIELTDYDNLEVILIDNGSRSPATNAYLKEVPYRVVKEAGPFNFSRLINRAAREATGDFLLLLNNDVEVMSPDWLREMVREGSQPRVGTVGALLVYPDGGVQHAGIILGLGGLAGHAYRHYDSTEGGYHGTLQFAREVSAVTGACLLTPSDVFWQVGGLDEGLPVNYNDVAYCLAILDKGLRNIITPYASLIHHESQSRTLSVSKSEAARFLNLLPRRDRYYSPILSRDREPGWCLASPRDLVLEESRVNETVLVDLESRLTRCQRC